MTKIWKEWGEPLRLVFGAAGRPDRTGVLALFLHVAVDELDHRHRGVVAVTVAGLEHADVAAVAGGVARAERGEELADLVDVADAGDGDASGVQVALLRQGHQ